MDFQLYIVEADFNSSILIKSHGCVYLKSEVK